MRDRLDILEFAQARPAARRGGGGGFIKAQVIRGLLRANPLRSDPEHSEYGLPVDGYDDYVLRLDGSMYTAWTPGTYPNDTLRTHTIAAAGTLYNLLWKVTANPETDSEPGYDADWAAQAEINPTHYSRGSVDWRDFDPWFQVGEYVPLVGTAGSYSIAQQMVYVGAVHPSRLWLAGDGSNGRSGAVFA